MRKTDAERRAFLKSFKLKMVQIQVASDARREEVHVTEDDLDAILNRTDLEWREQNSITNTPARASRARTA